MWVRTSVGIEFSLPPDSWLSCTPCGSSYSGRGHYWQSGYKYFKVRPLNNGIDNDNNKKFNYHPIRNIQHFLKTNLCTNLISLWRNLPFTIDCVGELFDKRFTMYHHLWPIFVISWLHRIVGVRNKIIRWISLKNIFFMK